MNSNGTDDRDRTNSWVRSWARHWSAGRAELAQRFNQLAPLAVLPLLTSLKLTPGELPVDLGSVENRVYSFTTLAGAQRVIKLYRPGRWSVAGLQEEMQFLHDLRAAGIRVVRPLRPAHENDIGTWDGIHYAIFEYVPHGKAAGRQLGEVELRELGRLAARIHEVGGRRPAWHRMDIEPLSMGLQNLEYVEQGGLVPTDLLPEYGSLAREIIARSVPLFDGVPRLRLHGDLGVHNLLFTQTDPVVADFDDFMVGPAAFDLCRLYVGLTTPWGDPNDDESVRDRVTELVVAGYRDVTPLPDEQLRPLEGLRALRMIWNDAWKRARLHDPHFCQVRSVIWQREFWYPRMAFLRRQLAKLRT